jgi:hypothetical protein
MFESAKNDLTQQALFGERVKTSLFLSMANDLPISVLLFEDGGTIDQGILKTGVVKAVSPGSGPPWKRCITGSFILKTDEDSWIEIQDVYGISFTEANDPVTFLKHKDTLNRIQHLRQIYMGDFGRKKIDIEIDDGNDSKYYRILSSISELKQFDKEKL